jgi:P-type E1-E2 ATPase
MQLVVGDIVILSTGDIVSADGYALGRNDLAINEKMLTGETVNKKKVCSVVFMHACMHEYMYVCMHTCMYKCVCMYVSITKRCSQEKL